MRKPPIYEERFSVRSQIVKKLFGDITTKSHPDAYAQIVFFNRRNPQILAANLVLFSATEKKESKMFEELIKSDLSYNECLMISSMYYGQDFSTIQRILKTKADASTDLEFLLGGTNGFILFCFQFEQVAQMVLDFSHDEAVILRKQYNKIQTCLDEYVPNKEKLSRFNEILSKHLVTKTVRYPNYSGAANLFKAYGR